MAFNFNWAPLSGDPGFYKRAEELLTDAMNKNQKPAIIVDDIIVTELNLGDIPPDLEVVEISDIGVDKFRGTFKMSYKGNAFITIKTRVQANPLNTYLQTRPFYTAPRPLAAAAPLTIPLQITLSDFQLSAIIILVFSKQKGLTIVFRNDPLESLKVSSTFDSIPFVANYLQTVIEAQLRTLFMDELPAIIHRMSLRLWVPEYRAEEERALGADAKEDDVPAVNPLATPPQDPVDSTGVTLNAQEVASLSLDSETIPQSLFSRKNLLRLATLTDSNRTLSLFTPNIRDAVFRAWTGPLERGEMSGLGSRIATPALSRAPSFIGSIKTAYTFENSSSRPPLHSHQSSLSSVSLGGTRLKGHGNRKRKKRVVNLRKSTITGEMENVTEDGSTVTDSTSMTGSISDEPSGSSISASPHLLLTTNPITPPLTPTSARRHSSLLRSEEATPQPRASQHPPVHIDLPSTFRSPAIPLERSDDHTLRPRMRQRRVVNLSASTDLDETPRASMFLPPKEPVQSPSEQKQALQGPAPLLERTGQSSEQQTIPSFLSFLTDNTQSQSIAERAWMMKMAAEVTRRYDDERKRGNFATPSTLSESDEPPPPAYGL